SAFQNLKYLASIRNVMSEADIKDVLRTVDLDPDSKQTVKKFSLGMKQRLAIAQAIMEYPKLLILDEPFNGLDKNGVDKMRALLLELKLKGTTILVTSHHREDIDILCDSVYEIDHKQLQSL
ncbi:ATP-binding cassette domain-containing protein, partial [Paenibacillus popilliae]